MNKDKFLKEQKILRLATIDEKRISSYCSCMVQVQTLNSALDKIEEFSS